MASRTVGVKSALVAVALVLAAGTGILGAATWNYTQHSNDFCTGCHVMNPAFQRFSSAENKHADLSCHDCHQQTLYASARQLYLWVAERPEVIGVHAKVPNEICANCHVTGDTATWQRIAATAGHRVHLESDSAALKDLQCVTCHGVEVHRFKPATETCGQSGCHKPSETGIVLGRMGTQTSLHCATCHGFTADVPALATRDSARGTLVPGMTQCLGCHQMRRVLEDFDEGKDPHGGKCGTCHNPHTQKTPAQATSCASSGCHANWRDEAFHVGASHKNISRQCLTCHVPHRSKLDASNCEGCHLSVRQRSRLRPPLPFDTTRALRRIGPTAPPDSTPGSGHFVSRASAGDTPTDLELDLRPGDDQLAPEPALAIPEAVYGGSGHSRPPPARADTFPHSRHVKLACLVCHETGAGHGRLTFERPRGCAICHHQAPTPAKCASCHRAEKFGAPKLATVTVTVPGRNPNPRPVEFLHARHASRSCVECHTTPVTLAPEASKALCKDCHNDHHTADRTCSSCHRLADPKIEHKTLDVAHQRCDACHTATTIAQLTPTRSFCSTCHAPKATGHYDQRECSVCHFLADPSAYRSKLRTQAGK